MWNRRLWMTLAAASGLLSVVFGAFAAHGLADPQAREWMHTGSTYQAVHALAAIACTTFMHTAARRAGYAPAFFLAGTVLFSGSLYAMALGGPRLLGAVTPVGGLCFLVGWGLLVWAAQGVDSAQR
jgi:uncharacterized membrane protein YgdD (TMEM256/DUF423 family)